MQHEAYSKHSFKTKKLDLFCFSADPSHLAVLGYSLPSWIISRILADGGKQNIEMIAHIVLHLKRDTQGNHQENKKTKKLRMLQ